MTAPKTEHHEGKGERAVPIFPELRPFLEEPSRPSPGGQVTSSPGAGTRSELADPAVEDHAPGRPDPVDEALPEHAGDPGDGACRRVPGACCQAWIGNSERVAADHYLQVTEDHWRRAAEFRCSRVQNRCSKQPQRRTDCRSRRKCLWFADLCETVGDMRY